MRIAPPRCLDQQLAHSAGRDALEVETRCGCDPGLFRQLQPRLIHQRRGTERVARIPAFNSRRQAPQLLVGQTEELVESLSFRRCLVRFNLPGRRRAPRISKMHDGFSPPFAQCEMEAREAGGRRAGQQTWLPMRKSLAHLERSRTTAFVLPLIQSQKV